MGLIDAYGKGKEYVDAQECDSTADLSLTQLIARMCGIVVDEYEQWEIDLENLVQVFKVGDDQFFR